LVDDVFSSHRLWKQSELFVDPSIPESTLFAPLQLDSKPVACFVYNASGSIDR
jgi:hypothetical protein